MTDHLATIIAARLVIAALDGGTTLMAIIAEGREMRPDLEWPTALVGDTPAQDPQDAPTELQDPT